MSFPFFDFFVNARHDYTGGKYRFSFLFQVSKEKQNYPEDVYIEFLGKKVLLQTDEYSVPVTQWVDVLSLSKANCHKKYIPYKVTYLDSSIADGYIIYIPPDERNIKFHISSCNINYNSNPEFLEYLSKNNLSRPGKIYDRTLLRYLFKKSQKPGKAFDVWLHIGDNIYEGIFNSYRDGKIDLDTVLEIQKQYYINSYNEESQGSTMRRCINIMIQDNNEYYSRIGQYPDYTSSDPFFRSYFETVYEKIVQKYQVFIFQTDDKAKYTSLSAIVKIGFYDVFFVNNIFSFYDTMINLSDAIRKDLTAYLHKLNPEQPPIVIMSRALENYTPVVSQRSTIRKSNTYGKQYDYYNLFRKDLFSCNKTCFTIGGDNHYYFLKKHSQKSLSLSSSIYDACSSGISVIDDDDDFDENILSVALNNKTESKFLASLRSKDYSTLIIDFSDKRIASFRFLFYNSDTNQRVRKEKVSVAF